MLSPHPQCAVCQTIEKEPRLEREIYNSTHFVKSSKISLLSIQKKYHPAFSITSLQNHTGKHQRLTPTQIANRNTRAINKQVKANQAVKAVKTGVVWDRVIGIGLEKLDKGELEMKTSDLLKAVKDKTDYELKVKDQEMQMAEMVAHFASGEGDINESRKYDRRIIEGEAVTDYDPTLQSSEDTDRRTEQSSTFYQSLIGDATPSGSD